MDQLITPTTNNVYTKSFEKTINTATATVKDKAVGDATSYLSSHNNVLLHKMKQVFACNMQLMEDNKEDLNVTAAVQTAIEDIIIPETTKKMLDRIINSDEIKCGLQNKFVALFKRQREMEDTFKTKMDRGFKEKPIFSNLQ